MSQPQEKASPDRGTAKRAKRFLSDVERLLKKHEGKVSEKERKKLTLAMDDVRQALEGTSDKKRLSTALKELDTRVDQVLGFAKKSTAREYTESIMIAVFIAVVLRAFVVEAFKIPTGSMIPTLEVGDHIFVNKFIYGLRVPLTNAWFVRWGSPERGDVIVFRYPLDLSKDYIKRVVAVAGDKVRVSVANEVYINGRKLERAKPTPFSYVEEGDDDPRGDLDSGLTRQALAYAETSAQGEEHYTVIYEHGGFGRSGFPHNGEQLDGLDCVPPTVPGEPGECTIKEGYVFVMGDNRDNSADSRVWGGVPNTYVKGKAMFVWWSRGPRSGVHWGRIGSAVH